MKQLALVSLPGLPIFGLIIMLGLLHNHTIFYSVLVSTIMTTIFYIGALR